MLVVDIEYAFLLLCVVNVWDSELVSVGHEVRAGFPHCLRSLRGPLGLVLTVAGPRVPVPGSCCGRAGGGGCRRLMWRVSTGLEISCLAGLHEITIWVSVGFFP